MWNTDEITDEMAATPFFAIQRAAAQRYAQAQANTEPPRYTDLDRVLRTYTSYRESFEAQVA